MVGLLSRFDVCMYVCECVCVCLSVLHPAWEISKTFLLSSTFITEDNLQ